MNTRLLLTSFFLGVLTAFVAWAFRWTLDSWEEATFDMPGEVTVLRLIKGPEAVEASEAESALEELKAYLRDHSLALIISSLGDGRPELVVYDPHNLVPWFPGCTSDESGSAVVDLYLFQGTYSENLWSLSVPNPLLPQDAVVRGIIVAPRRAGSLQYARCIGRDSLPEGQYTLNTSDPVQVQHILAILSRMGFTSQGLRKLPFFLYLVQRPLMVITLFFLIAGHGCVLLYWSLYLRGRSQEFGIRGRHGALPADLVRENLVGGLPGLVAGGTIGGVLAGVMVTAIGQVRLLPEDFLTLGAAVIVTIAVNAMAWFVVLFFSIRSQYEVSLAG